MFKLIVTLKNGGHQIWRMSRQMMAHVISLFQKMKKEIIFTDQKVYSIQMSEKKALILNDCSRLKFIDERSGVEFLTVE